MTNVSFFQRYSQKENHVTNNTVLILRHFYNRSPAKLNAILSLVFDDFVGFGVEFELQTKLSKSVLDAKIFQKPIEIFIETKLGPNLDEDQIRRHVKSIKEHRNEHDGPAYLIGLTTQKMQKRKVDELMDVARQHNVNFAVTTYSDFLGYMQENCPEFEQELLEIFDDYKDFIEKENLIPRRDKLTVVPCGQTMDINVKHRIYFEPAPRSSKEKSTYLGLYANKAVVRIGKLKAAYSGTVVDESFTLENNDDQSPSTEERNSIISAVSEAKPLYGNFAKNTHRFYFVEEFVDVNFRKTSKYGIWGPRIFYLSDLLRSAGWSEDLSVYETANMLNESDFE